MSNTQEHHLFVEKYRPKTIDDCILPPVLKDSFQAIIKKKNIPILMLAGSSGTGKTTVAKALCEQLGYDYIMINGSSEGRLIDTLRTRIEEFATRVSFGGNKKCVILDEADHLPDLVQAALRNFTEQHSKNCTFIFTCNFKNKLIQPLHSRCAVVDFRFSDDEKKAMLVAYLKVLCGILEKEGVEYEKPALAQLIMKNFPDFRKILNVVQRFAATGKIDDSVLSSVGNIQLGDLIGILKKKKFSEMRKWVAESSIDLPTLSSQIYESADKYVKPQSIPQLILTLADYQYKANFVADQEINTAAMLTELMAEIDWQ